MDAADVQLDLTSSQISNTRLIDVSMYATTLMSSSVEKEKRAYRWRTAQIALRQKKLFSTSCNFKFINNKTHKEKKLLPKKINQTKSSKH
jgi:Holliday junction resolvase-like predicted endonuclease